MGDEGGSETPACEHTNTTTNTVDATCTEAGSITVTCDDCGVTVSTEEIAALGHKDENSDNICDNCHNAISGTTESIEATLSFENANNRTLFSETQQVWTQNGITLTNDKGSSTSDIADYADPARFYKSSKIIVTA